MGSDDPCLTRTFRMNDNGESLMTLALNSNDKKYSSQVHLFLLLGSYPIIPVAELQGTEMMQGQMKIR